MDNPGLEEAADRMLDQVRQFVETLDPAERSLFAALLAPGAAAAWTDEDEVEGFGTVWSSSRIQQHLLQAVRDRNLRIEGL